MSAAKVNGEVVALTRAGYLASTSPYQQHHLFGNWVKKNEQRFKEVLQEGERLVGEWLAIAAMKPVEITVKVYQCFSAKFTTRKELLLADVI